MHGTSASATVGVYYYYDMMGKMSYHLLSGVSLNVRIHFFRLILYTNIIVFQCFYRNKSRYDFFYNNITLYFYLDINYLTFKEIQRILNGEESATYTVRLSLLNKLNLVIVKII